MPTDAHAAHVCSRLCQAPAAAAVALLSTAAGLARWNLGLWHTRQIEPDVFTGQSLFDGAPGWVRVRVHAELGLIDYWVGADAQSVAPPMQAIALAPRIQARVSAGLALGHAEPSCVVSLLAWRTAAMDDARWQRLVATHEVEIDIIRGQLEADAHSGFEGTQRA